MGDLIERDAVREAMRDCEAVTHSIGYSDMIAILDDAPAVNRWISVEDDLPEPFTLCLVGFSDGCVGLGEWDSIHRLWYVTTHQNGGSSFRVKHPAYWRPIPEIPKCLKGG